VALCAALPPGSRALAGAGAAAEALRRKPRPAPTLKNLAWPRAIQSENPQTRPLRNLLIRMSANRRRKHGPLTMKSSRATEYNRLSRPPKDEASKKFQTPLHPGKLSDDIEYRRNTFARSRRSVHCSSSRAKDMGSVSSPELTRDSIFWAPSAPTQTPSIEELEKVSVRAGMNFEDFHEQYSKPSADAARDQPAKSPRHYHQR